MNVKEFYGGCFIKNAIFMSKKLYNSSGIHEFAAKSRHIVPRIDIHHYTRLCLDYPSKMLRKPSGNHRFRGALYSVKTNDVIPNNDTLKHEALVTACYVLLYLSCLMLNHSISLVKLIDLKLFYTFVISRNKLNVA